MPSAKSFCWCAQVECITHGRTSAFVECGAQVHQRSIRLSRKFTVPGIPVTSRNPGRGALGVARSCGGCLARAREGVDGAAANGGAVPGAQSGDIAPSPRSCPGVCACVPTASPGRVTLGPAWKESLSIGSEVAFWTGYQAGWFGGLYRSRLSCVRSGFYPGARLP